VGGSASAAVNQTRALFVPPATPARVGLGKSASRKQMPDREPNHPHPVFPVYGEPGVANTRPRLDKACAYPGCDKPRKFYRYCHPHHNQARENNGVAYRPVMSHGGHRAWRKFPVDAVCLVDGCSAKIHARGYCGAHYQSVYRDPDAAVAATKKYRAKQKRLKDMRAGGGVWGAKHLAKLMSPMREVQKGGGWVLKHKPVVDNQPVDDAPPPKRKRMNIATATTGALLNVRRKWPAVKAELKRRGYGDEVDGAKWTQ